MQENHFCYRKFEGIFEGEFRLRHDPYDRAAIAATVRL